ncbi:MAG: hypothetical protein ICV60_14110 [Pyrinomonadaceae bacterium]|nr:hypothetical protein [Pyrinomonadaceae bacterium]
MRVNTGRGLLIVLALLLAGTSSAAGQVDSSKLVVTANILDRQYFCAAGSDMMTLQLRVRLRYTNAGNQKLILYRGEDLFYQAKIRPVSVRDGARPYEIVVLNARYLEVENEPVEQPAPGRLFVILQPGASYEAETTVGVGVVGQNSPRARHAIFEGEHTLQLLVVTWYRSRNLAEKLRERWQRKGSLWYSPVATNEMTFRAERPQLTQPCK